MNKFILFFIFFLFFVTDIFTQDLYINGTNDLRYIYKTASDSLHSYFDDEFGFNLLYKKFSYGMKFIAYLPRYNDFSNSQYLSPNELQYYWSERYVSYETEYFYALGGLFYETFGNGLILSSRYDKDFNIDTRITGSQIRILPDNWMFKAVYGTIENQTNKMNRDLVYGVDIQRYFNTFVFGTSAIVYRKKHDLDNKFSKFNIFSLRASYNLDLFETNMELAKIQEDSKLNDNMPEKNGFSFFATSNFYFKKFSFTLGYKNYSDFDIYINDPPRLNYSDEPLSENQKVGKDEQGIMAEFSFSPNYDNNFLINYSESWNNDKTIKLSDLFTKIGHTLKNRDNVAFEIENIERYEEPISEWTKETTPILTYDTKINKIAIYLKTKFKIEKKIHFDEESYHYEPLFQSDFAYENSSLSLIFVYPYNSKDDFMKNKLRIGAEGKTNLFNQTELTVFVGKETGGKVCRNGVCKYQTQFTGVRVGLSTQF